MKKEHLKLIIQTQDAELKTLRELKASLANDVRITKTYYAELMAMEKRLRQLEAGVTT